MSSIINVQITIDTESVKRDYANPSKDQQNPTPIGHQYEYMVVSDGAISGNGGSVLNFGANVGDAVRFFGTSTSDNFEDAVLVYGIERFGGDTVLNGLMSLTFTKSGVSPSGPDVLPAYHGPQQFWFYQGTVTQPGTENYQVIFALYERDDSGNLQIYGYFKWDPTITVNG